MTCGGVGELEGVKIATDTEETKIRSLWQVFGGTFKCALLGRGEVSVEGSLVAVKTARVAFVAVITEGYALAVPLELGIIVFDGREGDGGEIWEGFVVGSGGRRDLWECPGPSVAQEFHGWFRYGFKEWQMGLVSINGGKIAQDGRCEGRRRWGCCCCCCC